MKVIPIKEIQSKLNEVSSSFCLAKWLQTTTTLFNGMTHSCHHPGQHKISFTDIQNDYRLLHNTPKKIEARKEMLEGVQTKECDYCWRIENLKNKELLSDRVWKSSEKWASPNFNEVLNSGLGENIQPTYLEVSFENTCNFACYYCLPEISSRILGEVEKFGPYKLPSHLHNDLSHLHAKGSYPIHRDSFNPYIEAFWKWWPELRQKLDTFRITGGEPLLSKHTWKIFDNLIEAPNCELSFAINSNLGLSEEIINKLIIKIPEIAKSCRDFTIFTSAEGVGEDQEYARFGMNWDTFARNCESINAAIASIPNVNFVFMSTVNIFSKRSFGDFLEFVKKLKSVHNRNDKVVVSINFLRHPAFGSLINLTNSEKLEFEQMCSTYFNDASLLMSEKNQLKRLVEFMKSANADPNEIENFNFFFNEYDRRRNSKRPF